MKDSSSWKVFAGNIAAQISQAIEDGNIHAAQRYLEKLSEHCTHPLPKLICQLILAYSKIDNEISTERLICFAEGKIPLVHSDKDLDFTACIIDPVYCTYGATNYSPSYFMFEHILQEYGGDDIAFIARQMAFVLGIGRGDGKYFLEEAIKNSGIDIFKQYSVGEIGGEHKFILRLKKIFGACDDFNPSETISLTNYKEIIRAKYDITTSGRVLELCTQKEWSDDPDGFHYDVFTVFSNITKAGGIIIHRTYFAGNPQVLGDRKLHEFVGVEQVATMKSGEDWMSGTIFIYKKIDDREITAQQLYEFLENSQAQAMLRAEKKHNCR